MSRPPGGIGRRRFLGAGLGAAAVLGAAGISGCGGSVLTGSNQVRYWNLFSGGDGGRMVEMEKAYEKANPDVHLEAVTLSWGAPYYTKLAMAAAGGRAPEVAALHLSRLPGYSPGRMLDPFDQSLLADVGLNKEDFPETLWSAATVKGELYAVPLDTHGLVLYANRTVLDKAGLLNGPDELVAFDGPQGFLDGLDEISKVTGGLALGTANDPSTLWRYFWTFYRQAGGDIVLPVGGKVELDRPKMLEILEFYLKIFDGKRASPTLDGGGAITAFNEGKAGLLLNGNWELPTFETAKAEQGKPDFTMVPVPALYGDKPLVFADSHCLVLPHQNERDPDADRRTYELIASLLRNSMIWAGGGHIPAYNPVADSKEFQELKPQSNYRQMRDLAQLDPEAWFAGAGSDFQNQIGAALNAVFTKSLSPAKGVDQFEAAMNKLLAVPSPV